MRSKLPMPAMLLLITAFVSGCGWTSQLADTESSVQSHHHSHGDEDMLVWVDEGVEHEGFVLAIGHHGKYFHADSSIEPAVSITRDDMAVSDAKVFNSLVSADGAEVIGKEVPTVYEPETADEPAHYAQGQLHIPKSVKQFIIRFRIVLPGADTELNHDVTIEVDH